MAQQLCGSLDGLKSEIFIGDTLKSAMLKWRYSFVELSNNRERVVTTHR